MLKFLPSVEMVRPLHLYSHSVLDDARQTGVTMPAGQPVSFVEVHGRMQGPSDRPLAARQLVVFSNIERGGIISAPMAGLCVRLVGRGRESYRIGERAFHLDEAQIMIASHEGGAEIEIPKRDRNGTIGLCVFLPYEPEEAPWLAGPLVAGSACSPFGMMLESYAKVLANPSGDKQAVAASLAAVLRSAMPSVTSTVLEQAASMDAAKPSTRFELVRRANLAQAYLHSVRDRAVPLEELAKAVGTSSFQLLRAFQRCFGDTPASYHRRLRLTLAMDEAARKEVSITAVAADFGFADVSSFSHAYRRVFGRAPVWSRG